MMNCVEKLEMSAEFWLAAAGLDDEERYRTAGPLTILTEAFMASRCDVFASVVQTAVGWPIVRVEWSSGDDRVHHLLNESPMGLVDVTGWTTVDRVRQRLGVPPGWMMTMSTRDGFTGGDPDEMYHAALAMTALPYAPFDDPAFRGFDPESVMDAAVVSSP